MLAHAMSSTKPVTHKSRISGAFASRVTELWPCAPGATSMSFARKRFIVASLMPFCSGASTSLTIW